MHKKALSYDDTLTLTLPPDSVLCPIGMSHALFSFSFFLDTRHCPAARSKVLSAPEATVCLSHCRTTVPDSRSGGLNERSKEVASFHDQLSSP